MTTLRILLLSFIVVSLPALVTAQDFENPLPVPVTIGGQAAVPPAKKGDDARIPKPVAAGSKITIGGLKAKAIVSFMPIDAKGMPLEKEQSSLMSFEPGQTRSIDDGHYFDAKKKKVFLKLKPGRYFCLVNTTGQGAARVIFDVK